MGGMMSAMTGLMSMSMPAIHSVLINAGATLFVGYSLYSAYNIALDMFAAAGVGGRGFCPSL